MAFIGKVYGATLSSIFGSGMSHENVIFDAYFQDNETLGKDFESNVNNDSLEIKFDLDVEKAGYLKDACIEILPVEGEKLNFEIDKDIMDSGTEETIQPEGKNEQEEILVEQEQEEKTEEESKIENIELTPPVEDNTNTVVEETTTDMTNNTTTNTIQDTAVNNNTNSTELQTPDSLTLDMNDSTNTTLNTTTEDTQKIELTMGDESLFNTSESISLSLDNTETDTQNKLFNMEQITKFVETLDGNTINLKQIRATSNVEIEVPIRYQNEKYISSKTFSNKAIARLTGTYVDKNGEENNIEYNQELSLSWKDERLIKLDSEITKYIDYGNGVILQTKVVVSNKVDNNTLPVKESNLQINVPAIMEKYPQTVNVTANNLYATNGETYGNNTFSKDNWNYDRDQNILNITVENKEKESNYYDENKGGIKEQELSKRYYNGSGEDEYLITYIYQGVSAEDTRYTVDNNIEAQMKIFSGISSENGENIVTDSHKEELILEKTTGEIASLEVENMTETLSKAYFYANYRALDTYDLNITAKYVMNIANKDLVDNLYFEDVQNFYIDKSGNNVPNDDLTYKEIVVNRSNFEDILGLDGEIKIYDADNKTIEYGKINKDTVVDTNGDMSLFVQGKIDRIRFEVSKPISEGNLVVTTVKGLSNLSISKEEFQNMGSILTRTDFNVKYSEINEELNLGTKNTLTELLDTKTKANLVVDKVGLSTLSLNENVDLKIELNNDESTSDLYGHSVFEIEYPSYVDDITILNTSLLYGEGLDIAYVNNQDRKITVVTDGVQKELNSGILTNGTNIVISANIKVNVFAPAIIDSFKMTYTNDEATDYFEEGKTEAYVKYLSPSGLVTVNTIRNYKDNTNFITSVRQGSHSDLLNLYQEEKVASMEILAMNNSEENIENINILGRFPYKGMKDILTGKDMGNTRNVKVTGIVSDTLNQGEFNIYYSSVEEATDDLEDSKNRWTENIESIVEPKSFLIVPKDKNYQLLKSEIIKFHYDFIIPANMGHGEKIVGTFVANYDGKSEGIVQKSYPDIVYLDTESGPELEVEVDANDEVYEDSELYTTVLIRNKGEYVAKNVTVRIPVPNNTEYVSYYTKNEKDLTVTKNENEVVVNLVALDKNTDVVFDVIYRVNDLNSFTTDDENREVEINASVEASDLGSVIKAESKKVKIKKAEIVVRESSTYDENEEIYKEGSTVPINISISNVSENDIDGAILEKNVPEGFQLIEVNKYENEDYVEVEGKMFDGKLSIELGKINHGESQTYRCTYKVESVKEEVVKDIVKSKSVVIINGKEYESNELKINIARPNLELIQETDSNNTYIRESDIVNYSIKVKNNGGAEATGLSFEDIVPSGLSIISYKYTLGGMQREVTDITSDKIHEYIYVGANEEVVFNITARAQSDIDSLEKSVTNVAKVNSSEQGVITSNSITHIIEKREETQEKVEEKKPIEIQPREEVTQEPAVEEVQIEEQNVNLGNAIETPKLIENISNKENIERTYKISGYIWEDNNQDGIRGNGEGKIDDYNDMTVRLVNAESGVIEAETSPDEIGYYVFQGVKNGNHYIVLNYNTRKYGITTYKKEGASEIVNSDIIASKVEENGTLVNTAITDRININNKSISNIDMGLFYADRFDLEVENTITQVMVQTSRGMETTNYDYQKLAKVEVAPNDLDGSTVYVEYTIKVSNKGDVAGYAKKIVNYISDDMEFNSGLEANIKWFGGTDGNIYTNELANVELKPGETKEIKLVLQKKMTEVNTGLVNNQVEIADDYNIYGIADIDSTAGNNVQAEDDMALADIIITLETGEKIMYIIFIVILMALVVSGGYTGYIKLWPKIEPRIKTRFKKNEKSGKKEE